MNFSYFSSFRVCFHCWLECSIATHGWCGSNLTKNQSISPGFYEWSAIYWLKCMQYGRVKPHGKVGNGSHAARAPWPSVSSSCRDKTIQCPSRRQGWGTCTCVVHAFCCADCNVTGMTAAERDSSKRYYTERTDKKAMNINVDNKEGAEILDCWFLLRRVTAE